MSRSIHRRTLLLLLFGLALVAAVPASGQEHWPRFRGPNGKGLSDAKTIPVQWSERDYNWKVKLPGGGHSSPAIRGDRLYITASDRKQQRWTLLCLNPHTGERRWTRSFPFKPYRQHQYNSFAAATPALDSQRVYTTHATPKHYYVYALTHQGEPVWRRDLGPFVSQHGGTPSPMVYKDMVVVPNDQRGEKAFLIALDRKTGQTRWKIDRPGGGNAAYAVPTVYDPDHAEPRLIFTSHMSGISAVDPEQGRIVWEKRGLYDKRSLFCPQVAGGLIFGSCGSGGGGNYVVAIRPPSPDGPSKPQVAYEIRDAAPYVPTPVAVGDLLFLVHDGGIASCVHAPTGKVRWRERLDGRIFFGSPVCVDGKIYVISRQGKVNVFRASNEFEMLAINDLGEMSHATPAIAHGRMYLRTLSHLISIGGDEQ